ncbi:MAG: tetratricopeptide repeat protein [Deltaproteobacteria bacterium]|nr:tetratricopeptide repeat protein [Deltaproteobacteria bacterium]
MKRHLFRLLFSAMVATMMTAWSVASWAITKEEVMTLTKLGIPEAEVVKAIDKDRTVFNLKIQDILELKKAGVPDKVIKYMLATPQKYGKAPGATSATSEGAAESAAEKPAAVHEKTPEEIKAEEERQREEARRKAYARGIMRQGLALAEDGEWVDSIELFQQFLKRGNFGPGTAEFYNAKYGIAAALTEAHLYQSAAKLLVEVLLEGTDKPFFKEAFQQLRSLRKEIIYNPPDLEQLTNFQYGSFSQSFQDSVNYVLGEFFYDYGNYQRAIKHFQAVSEDSPDRGKALYLLGLVQVRYKMYKSAVESIQEAILAAERIGDDPVVDLGYMALARIAYEAQQYDAAVFYYKKVPSDSVRAARVFYEIAWTYLLKGDYSRALGAFHAMHSPYFKETFHPELWILEARVYSDLCRYEQARKALDAFARTVGIYMEPLKQFIAAQKSPDDYHKDFVGSVNQDPSVKVKLPLPMTYPVLSNIEFYNVYRTIRQIEREQAEISAAKGRLGSFANEMLVKLAVLRKDRIFESGVKIQQILNDLDVAMGDAQVHETEIEVDINSAAIDKMTMETRMMVGEGDEGEKEIKRAGPTAIIGGDTQVWPFEGEYWHDEIDYYRSMLTSQCID